MECPGSRQRGTTHGATGTMITNRADPRTSSTTDWRWMTAGIRATEALQRNFGRGDHGRVVQRDDDHARVRRDQFRDRDFAFGREVRGDHLARIENALEDDKAEAEESGAAERARRAYFPHYAAV